MGAIKNEVLKRYRNAPVDIPEPTNELTEEELAAIQARLHLRIYEPLVDINTGEFVFDTNTSDILVGWGGNYVTP